MFKYIEMYLFLHIRDKSLHLHHHYVLYYVGLRSWITSFLDSNSPLKDCIVYEQQQHLKQSSSFSRFDVISAHGPSFHIAMVSVNFDGH